MLISVPSVLKGWCLRFNNLMHGQEIVVISGHKILDISSKTWKQGCGKDRTVVFHVMSSPQPFVLDKLSCHFLFEGLTLNTSALQNGCNANFSSNFTSSRITRDIVDYIEKRMKLKLPCSRMSR